MFKFSLTVDSPSVPPQESDAETFYWHNKSTSAYFGTNIGPLLGEFGAVNNRNIDLVRIASGVLAADRSASRSGTLSTWNQRDISLTVDLTAVGPWNVVKKDLEKLLGFLTGDAWTLTFRRRMGSAEQLGTVGMEAERVVLVSGGADSATGALMSALDLANHKGKQVLVSHWSSKNLPAVQKRIVQDIDRFAPGTTADHLRIHHARGRHSPSGLAYGRENSTRSRSLLFIALGLAVASVNEIPLWIPENGYASINPPLSRSRRGSLSTKTTHPKFFNDLITILERVGAHSKLENPHAAQTKGEMFRLVADAIGDEQASRYLSGTVSCSHTGARSYHISPLVPCGVCFGCVLRRASFTAAKLTDLTPYLKPVGSKQEAWVAGKSVVPAMRDFLASSFDEADLARLQIPADLALSDINGLIQRGRAELRLLNL